MLDTSRFRASIFNLRKVKVYNRNQTCALLPSSQIQASQHTVHMSYFLTEMQKRQIPLEKFALMIYENTMCLNLYRALINR